MSKDLQLQQLRDQCERMSQQMVKLVEENRQLRAENTELSVELNDVLKAVLEKS